MLRGSRRLGNDDTRVRAQSCDHRSSAVGEGTTCRVRRDVCVIVAAMFEDVLQEPRHFGACRDSQPECAHRYGLRQQRPLRITGGCNISLPGIAHRDAHARAAGRQPKDSTDWQFSGARTQDGDCNSLVSTGRVLQRKFEAQILPGSGIRAPSARNQ